MKGGIFTGLGSGGTALDAGFFAAGAARDGGDRVVYETGTGRLFFDADGDGADRVVFFAVLTNKATLAAADFLVV